VGLGTLTTNRQAATVAQATVATQIHQALDLHIHFTTQVAFGIHLGYFATQLFDLLVSQILDFCCRINAGSSTDFLCSGATNTKDVGQRDNSVLVIRNVNACNTGHSVELQLTATYAPEAKK